MRRKSHFVRWAGSPPRSRKTAGLATATLLACVAVAGTQVAGASGAPTSPTSDIPYQLPVTNLPAVKSSPLVTASAPYTPAVMNIIAQLEPSLTVSNLANAAKIFADGTNSTCPSTGPVGTPTQSPSASVPSIMPECWTDAQGVNLTSGPNAANDSTQQGNTTGPMDLMGLGASFDRNIANLWGQTEGTEAREEMITGLYGPQTDIDRSPNWGRNLTTTGADPYLSGQLVAAQINGMQADGTMSQMKHFAAYNGENQSASAQVQDQAMHQVYLTPYESGFVYGGAAATMCSYQLFQDTSTTLPGPVPTLASTYPLSPYGSSSQMTWPLNESHQACEQPLTLTYALRDLWGSKALVATDYGAAYSTAGINQGEQQEMPSALGFSATTTPGVGGFNLSGTTGDPTGDTCIDANGNAESCSAAGATHIAGIPGANCPVKSDGCSLVYAVVDGYEPLSVFNQDLATQLYQEQRFGMLGCNQTPVLSMCTDPGGVGSNRSQNETLPNGPTSGATPAKDLGTKTGDEAAVELESEHGGVLLKNDNSTLPITQSDEKGGVLVTGATGQYLIADPTSEASIGFTDRDDISPLQQLEALSNDPSAFSYSPALDPVGEPVPSSALSTSNTHVTGNLSETSTPSGGSAHTSTASSVDHTTVSSQGQLAAGSYSWTGYLYVPTSDTYSLDFQLSSSLPKPVSEAILGQTWSGGTATLTMASGQIAAVGSQVTVGGACQTGYDGTFTVTASTATSVSYALPSNPGSCTPVSLNVTGATYTAGTSFGPFSSPGTETLNFATTTTVPSVGSSITVSGANPSALNGTYTVTASTPTSVTWQQSTNPGTYVSGGTIAAAETGTAALGALQVSFDGKSVSLTTPANINSTGTGTPAASTNAGYTEAGLTNLQYTAGSLSPGYYPITISYSNTSDSPASLRFGYSRANGDIADAAQAAKGKKMAIVFVDDTAAASESGSSNSNTASLTGTTSEVANPEYNSSQPISDSNLPYISSIESLPGNQTALVEAVAKANPNTVVVLNTENPVLMPWVKDVKSVLEMWYAGEEGGTSTARLLLGQADPSGHLPITFPANPTDTIWGFDEKTPLYAGDPLGQHPERLNSNGGCSGTGCPASGPTNETEGIYTDYRFFDKEGINALFPFGWGLSYAKFQYSGLKVSPASDGGLDVSVRVTNTSDDAGAAVPQVYLGAPSDQPAGIQFAVRQLVQFARVELQPHESQDVDLHVTLRQMQYWDSKTQQWLMATGSRTVYVGDADSTQSPVGDPGAGTSLPLQTTIHVSANGTGNAATYVSDHGHGGPGLTCDDEQLSATLVSGDLVVPRGQWCDIIDTTVKGNLVISDSAGVRVEDSSVSGNVEAVNNNDAIDPLSSDEDVLCSTTVGGSVRITGSGHDVPWNLGLCGGNTIHGRLVFAGNAAAGNSISGNTVDGELTCVGNGSVTAAGNTVEGAAGGQCTAGSVGHRQPGQPWHRRHTRGHH